MQTKKAKIWARILAGQRPGNTRMHTLDYQSWLQTKHLNAKASYKYSIQVTWYAKP